MERIYRVSVRHQYSFSYSCKITYAYICVRVCVYMDTFVHNPAGSSLLAFW